MSERPALSLSLTLLSVERVSAAVCGGRCSTVAAASPACAASAGVQTRLTALGLVAGLAVGLAASQALGAPAADAQAGPASSASTTAATTATTTANAASEAAPSASDSAAAPAASAASAAAASPSASAAASASANAPTAAPSFAASAPALAGTGAGRARAALPLWLQADTLRLRPERDAQADGAVELRQADTVIRTQRLQYDWPTDRATASGGVQMDTPGARYSGSSLQLQLQRFEGQVLDPRFELTALGAGGSAQRLDILDANRSTAHAARYSSCPRDGSGTPDWLLRAQTVTIDQEKHEGVAEGAVLQFLGLPVLGLPVLSFPLDDTRKSGWLPPTIVPVSSRNGLTLGVPYYWNIAPHLDATLSPVIYSRIGLAMDGEFRYLATRDAGQVNWSWLPHDRQSGGSRLGWWARHEGQLDAASHYTLRWLHASDDAYWKDFSGQMPSTTPRLLTQQLAFERRLPATWGGDGSAYARVQRWQLLQTGSSSDERISAPYQREPQLGLQWQGQLPPLSALLSPAASSAAPSQLQLRGEFNRFTLPQHLNSADDSSRPRGWRGHLNGSWSWRLGQSGLWLIPKLQLRAVHYWLDPLQGQSQREMGRVIPTFSLDHGMAFERESTWFGRPQRQTLEPRLVYLRTPYHRQDQLPLFDSAERDFNTISLFADNAFAGVDRVSDANLLTGGFVSRWVDAVTGAETLRLGVAQRLRLSTQRVTSDGQPQSQRFSDVLFDGATSLFAPWSLDGTFQYNPDSGRIVRSAFNSRWTPGPFRTLSLSYSMARDTSEQLQLGWQWPVWRGSARPLGASNGCGGTLYAVGRGSYSLRDSRTTDLLAGVEYDAGCWIGRLVLRRQSTTSQDTSTQLMWQVEFVGLSRLGSNPLQTLKDNVPGYRLLREPGDGPQQPDIDP